ncbi:hypothetical protein OCGS_0612 [Oceaniovalibus guishaninsula JLT2003]|uniref:Lipoprotein n=1 Tax=Oceaniovalibus guishaninsula JLT2003 TaxID=1231392 RepID=K2HGE8_9RHOB|nr:hypothetical protein [Oceaniovalibus guishaninsula]EKE45522.1 hypothetical protein OCGS_0612 [Oceaniovalibus guishaninsula JLT2003]
MALRTIALTVLALPLAACAVPGQTGFGPGYDSDRGFASAFRRAPPQPSPAALAALPAGMNPDFLIKGGDGCYLIALEQGDPPMGVPLLNSAGVQVCDV